MSYEFEIDRSKGILIVKHHGKLKVNEALASRAEGVPILIEHEIRKVLIDLRGARVVASPSEIFEFQAAEPREFPLGTRVAMVLSPESWAEDDVQFAVNVATNRGLIERAFTDLKEAVTWVTGQGD
jgi:hypothetical protein